MEKINDEFNISYYIFEEIIEYVEQTARGDCKCMKWENIKSLLNLAVVNKRITRLQADHLKKRILQRKSFVIIYFMSNLRKMSKSLMPKVKNLKSIEISTQM